MDPVDTVRKFLDMLAAGQVDPACDLLTDDVVYQNVTLPTVRGRDKVRRIMEMAFGPGRAGLEVYFHTLSFDGPAVLTERTDVIILGPIRVQMWVCGRFDVADGRITRWKDYFDWATVLVAGVRGLLGAVIPALRPKPPTAGVLLGP